MHYQSCVWLFVVQGKKKKENHAVHRSNGKGHQRENHIQVEDLRMHKGEGHKHVQNLSAACAIVQVPRANGFVCIAEISVTKPTFCAICPRTLNS